MDVIEFTKQASADKDIAALLQQAADAVRANGLEDDEDTPKTFVTITGVDLLFGIAAYALYRLVRSYMDHLRDQNETETARARAELIADMKNDGFPPEHAEKVVNALLKSVAERSKDDPALEKAITLLGTNK